MMFIKHFKNACRIIKNILKGTANVRCEILPEKQNVNIVKAKEEFIRLHQDVTDELMDLNSIEYRIVPTKLVNMSNMLIYNKHYSYDYVRLVANSKEKYDIVITIKQLRTGGTDKLLLGYIRGIKKYRSDLEIAILVLEGDRSAWSDEFSKCADVFYCSKLFVKKHQQSDWNYLFERFIEQKKVHILWNFNCRECYLFQECRKREVSKNLRIWNLIFAHWLKPNSRIEFGMAHENLPFVIDKCDRIISDNQTFIEYITHQYGWNREKFTVLYIPNSEEKIALRSRQRGKRLNILWASGIEWNKGVKILPMISELTKDINVHIDVYGTTKNESGKQLLNKLIKDIQGMSNICYKGGFSNFKEILSNDSYDAFLFTSIVEGMPNVILEAAEAQLNIISSKVGGIEEFLNDTNAYLISNSTDANEYASKIRQRYEDFINENDDKINRMVQSYNEKFTSDRFVTDFKRIYENEY
jgi:glycosyltransferase involved in cell wall biosynthesis